MSFKIKNKKSVKKTSENLTKYFDKNKNEKNTDIFYYNKNY